MCNKERIQPDMAMARSMRQHPLLNKATTHGMGLLRIGFTYATLPVLSNVVPFVVSLTSV